MRIAIVLPGLHRVSRGAEVAFEALGRSLAVDSADSITLIGTGAARDGDPYHFLSARSVPRERFESWPRLPPFRSEFGYEEFTWLPSFLRRYRAADYDVVVTCSYPFTNWALRIGRRRRRPANVFVTQNGDWPATNSRREYRLFGCDGLVCTNPQYFERSRDGWRSALVPNGVDVERFHPGDGDREALGLPADANVVLMVSAMNANKRVADGIRAVAAVPDSMLVVAGDGPLRDDIDRLAHELMPGRFRRVSLPSDQMPALYRAADVFLHTTLLESFGNVYLEAMATGLPVVAHGSPVAEWIMEDRAQLVDTTDLAATSAAVSNALSGEWGVPAGSVAAVAARFDWAVVAAQYRAFFVEVLQSLGRAT